MKSYEETVHKAGSGFHMNPSPGNIKDGLITDAIKSQQAQQRKAALHRLWMCWIILNRQQNQD